MVLPEGEKCAAEGAAGREEEVKEKAHEISPSISIVP